MLFMRVIPHGSVELALTRANALVFGTGRSLVINSLLTIDQCFNVQVLSGTPVGGCRTSKRWLWPFELTLGIGSLLPLQPETDGSDQITDLELTPTRPFRPPETVGSITLKTISDFECVYAGSFRFKACTKLTRASKCEVGEKSSRLLPHCSEFSVLCPVWRS